MYLESDSFQFIVKEYTGKTYIDAKGKEVEHYNTHGYFPSIESALRHVVKMKLKESTAMNLQELITDLRRIEEWLHEQLKEIA